MKETRLSTPNRERQLTLFELAGWDLKTIQLLEDYRLIYASTPSSKLLLSTMIKFDEMYRPLKTGPFRIDWGGAFAGLNEERMGRRAEAYLYRKDLVKVVDSRGGKSLVLTTRAHKMFYQTYPLAVLRKQKWDGYWTIISYDFPILRKTDRDYFRRKIIDLGFGSPQESLFVSPLSLARPLRELVEGERFEDLVWVLRAETVLGMENRQVAEKSWNLGQMNKLYSALLEALPLVKRWKNRQLLTEWQKYFLALDLVDPYLPFELLPADWQGEWCRKEFSKLGLAGLLRSIFVP